MAPRTTPSPNQPIRCRKLGNRVARRKYKAKVDWWIGASILIGMAVPFVVAATMHLPWMYAVGTGVLVLVFGFCYPQSYETTDAALVIRAGFSRRTIAYPEITAVRPSSDSRSALALSLDRVQIQYAAAGDLLIAPEDKAAFMADVASRAPHLSRHGQELVVSLN